MVKATKAEQGDCGHRNRSATRNGIEVKYRATLNECELSRSREIAEMLGCKAYVVACKEHA